MGPRELKLIAASGYLAFPPRLPGQPIFYPVLTEEYAIQIARDWNVPQTVPGFVTRFQVSAAFLAAYEVHQVGGQIRREHWIPAEDLRELPRAMVGPIEVIREFS